MEEDPFCGLKILSHDFLENLGTRSVCPQCQKSRKYYCYTCYVPVSGMEDKVPKVKLPFKIDIIKHPSECDGKSTSAHAGVICPDDVKIYTYPCIPDYPVEERVVLVFPGENSVSMDELIKSSVSRTTDRGTKLEHISEAQDIIHNDTQSMEAQSSNKALCNDDAIQSQSKEELGSLSAGSKVILDREISPGKRKHDSISNESSEKLSSEVKRLKPLPPFDRAVFIDCTWNQTKRISSDERLKDLPCVELKSRKTQFWRHQRDNPATYLATIEAIYYFLRDYHDLYVRCEYQGQYDNLLFFFNFMYQKIRKMYKGGGDLKAYKERAQKQ